MATRSFVVEEQLVESEKILEPLKGQLQDPLNNPLLSLGLEYSKWLSSYLEKKFSQISGWNESHPIALGSWARDELCPKSDIDLLFCGDEKAALEFVQAAQNEGLRIRYRFPKDKEDWTVGVEDFDTLALIHARAFTWEGGVELTKQKEKLFHATSEIKNSLLKTMSEERDERNVRYDSLINYLEPNIKYGKGGLRDIQQGLYIFELFKEKFSDAHNVSLVLEKTKLYFLNLRHLLHLRGASEVLHSNVQQDIYSWCGYDDNKTFMRELQNVLETVSFLSDWIIERARASNKKIQGLEDLVIKKAGDGFGILRDNSDILTQERVRRSLEQDPEVTKKTKDMDGRTQWRILNKYFQHSDSEEYFISLFRSRLIDRVIPDIERVRGLVQHDQYHRYTVDGHIQKILSVFARTKKNSKEVLGDLAPHFKSLDDEDLKILLWSCLFHDLAKGLDGDHSDVGADLAEDYFEKWGAPTKLTGEVVWMVKNHLVMSQAAFRHNPGSPSNWRYLHNLGVQKKRVIRLGILTALDIQATNPEAWNTWKSGLLAQLIENLQSKKAEQYFKLLEVSAKKNVELSRDFVRELAEDLVEQVAVKDLIEDYQRLQIAKEELPPLFVKSKDGTMWVRFHKTKDEPGTFLSFVKLLYGAGAQVQQAQVRTHSDWGVYDWFNVKTNKTGTQLKKLFGALDADTVAPPGLKFEKIKDLGPEDDLHLVSFTGVNKTGVLLQAAHDLSDQELSVQWARIHTWGNQVECIFALNQDPQIKEKLGQLVSSCQS